MSKVEQLLASLKDGSRKVTSEFRNENAQTKSRAMKFPTLKKETKKRSRVLPIVELAIPFNPFTGQEDGEFNRNNKYRPIMSVESAMKVHKKLANENEGVKETYKMRAGVESWDTTNLDEITDVDRTIFAKYRQPVVFSVTVVDINIPALTGQDRAKQYKIDVNRNPITDKIDGKMPTPLKVHKLLNDRAWVARQEFENEVKSGKIVLNEKDLKEKRREFYKDVVVSTDHPLNTSLCIELKLDNDLSLDEKLAGLQSEDIMGMLKVHKYSHNYGKSVKLFLDGTNAKADKCLNFYEMDMICSDDTDGGQLGLNTSFNKADSEDSIIEHKDFEEFNKALVELLDSETYAEQLENIFQRSIYVTEFTPEIEGLLIDSLPTVISLDDPRMTGNVIKQNQEIITRAFGGAGDEALLKSQMGIIPEGELDEEASAKAGREASLEEITKDDDVGGINLTQIIPQATETPDEIEDEI